MFCTNCGNPVNEDKAFCINCGNKIGTKEPSKQTQTNAPAKLPKTVNKAAINGKSVVVAASLVIVLAGVFFYWKSMPAYAEAVPYKYDDVDIFSEGLAAVKFGDKWGFINKSGKEIVSFKYNFVYNFSGGMAMIEEYDGHDSAQGFIDKSGKEVVPLGTYHIIQNERMFSAGIAAVCISKCGFINKLGKEIVPLNYDMVGISSEGMAAVRFDGKWGFIRIK